MRELHFTRRSLIESVARVAALPAGAAFLAEWAKAAQAHQHGSAAPPQPERFRDYHPQFFSPADYAALESFTEILIPSDETPGAREALCACFLDFMLHAQAEFAPGSEKPWRDGLEALRAAGFHAATPERRLAIMEEISLPERDRHAQHPAYSAYRLIKRETAFAFYTARAGMIECLDYRGNSYNLIFPGCTHPEHRALPRDVRA